MKWRYMVDEFLQRRKLCEHLDFRTCARAVQTQSAGKKSQNFRMHSGNVVRGTQCLRKGDELIINNKLCGLVTFNLKYSNLMLAHARAFRSLTTMNSYCVFTSS